MQQVLNEPDVTALPSIEAHDTGCVPDESGDPGMSVQQVEKDIVEIRETLRWHGIIGSGAITVFAAIAIGFITWYLPKELGAQKADILQGMALEIGKIPVSTLNKLLLPNDKLTTAPASELSTRFQQIKSVTDVGINGKLIAAPESLARVHTFLTTSLTIRHDLPPEIRNEGVAALVNVSGYSAVSQNILDNHSKFIIEDLSLADETGGWPTTEMLAGRPSDLKFVVVRNVLFQKARQDISNITWLGDTFDHSVVVYNGGSLRLADAIFKDCTFVFGDDPTSQAVKKLLEESQGKPVSILITPEFSSLSQS